MVDEDILMKCCYCFVSKQMLAAGLVINFDVIFYKLVLLHAHQDLNYGILFQDFA